MGNETLDLDELSAMLKRDSRELQKLAVRGLLPGRKVGGEWRFSRSEIHHWLEREMPGLDDDQLRTLEVPHPEIVEPLLTGLLSPACIEVPLDSRTKSSLLRGMVRLAEQSWQVYDPDVVLDALKAREELASTALENGVAILHPRRPMPSAYGESLVALGRTSAGIPFGAPNGRLTDLYFLVLSLDDRTHLRILARLTRIMLRPGVLDALRSVECATEALHVIREAEAAMLAEDES